LGQGKRIARGKWHESVHRKVINTAVSSALSGLRRVSLISAVLSFALVVWGAVVRVHGAGMTCPDWPRCQGSWLPALDNVTVYEWSHRLGAIIVTTIILATFAMAWRCRADRPAALRAAWFSVSLIVAQIIAGWLTIKYQNNPPSVALHLMIGFLTFVSLLLVTAIAYSPARARGSAHVLPDRGRNIAFARLALVSTIVAFVAVFAAGYMSAANDGLACAGFPLCNGFGGALTPDQQIHMGHRFSAYATIVAVMVTAFAAFSTQRTRRDIVTVSWVALGLVILQGTLGVFAVITRLDPILRVWHEANGALVAGSLALLTYFAYARPAGTA
jgi:cytochrome c oxidase assembly protein subunit 15